MGKKNGFGDVVQRYRERAGLTQSELAGPLGVTQQTVGKWESGVAYPRPAIFAQLNDLLNIPAREIADLYGPSKGARSPIGKLFDLTPKQLESQKSEVTIGDRIKQQREEMGISMQDLAEVVGVSAWQTVQQWENNTTAPARKRLGIVAEVLGVTAEYLMFGDDRADGRIAPMADEATLRDEFAAKAMAAYIAANPDAPDTKLASLAYATADAMLAERAKP